MFKVVDLYMVSRGTPRGPACNVVETAQRKSQLITLPTTPLVTCLSGALDRRLLSLLPESLTGGWLVDYLDTQVRH